MVDSRHTRCGAGLLGAAVLLVLLDGCNSVKSSLDNNVELRKNVVDSARKSCVTEAEKKLAGRTDLHPKVVAYCDCFATEGMAKFSNSELMEVGVRGADHLTPAQNQKLMDAVKVCEQKASII